MKSCRSTTDRTRAGRLALLVLSAATLSGCSGANDSGPAEGGWSYQVSAASGVASMFVSDGHELLRVGCRSDPPSLFVDIGQSENAGKPVAIAFGDKTIDLKPSDAGFKGVTRLTPEQVDVLDDGAVRMGEMTLPPIAPDALAALQRGCSQVIASSPPANARWMFSEADGRAVLAFALPDSDYPGPRFECERGAGAARLILQGVRTRPRRIVATAGNRILEGQVSFEPDQLNGGEIWSARVTAEQAVLHGMEQSGNLRIEYPEPRTNYTSKGAGLAAARFRAACVLGRPRPAK